MRRRTTLIALLLLVGTAALALVSVFVSSAPVALPECQPGGYLQRTNPSACTGLPSYDPNTPLVPCSLLLRAVTHTHTHACVHVHRCECS